MMEALPAATRAALEPVLGPTEPIVRYLEAVGCSLILTDTRLILVREGVSYRPRSGVQTWPLDRSTVLRSTPVRHGTGRVVIDREARSTSVFIVAAHWREAEHLIGEARSRMEPAR